MKKKILASLLAAGMIVSNTPAVMAKGRTVSVLTKISYDAHYAFQGKSSIKYGYNRKGLVSLENDHWAKSDLGNRTQFYYNKKNKIVREKAYNFYQKKSYTISDHKYNKKGQLISLGEYKFTYKNNRLTGVIDRDMKGKLYYNKKGQLIKTEKLSAFETNPVYRYDSKGYLKELKDSCIGDGPVTYKNTYRNGLLVKQNYRYRSINDVGRAGKVKKGSIIYQYKKIHVSSDVYRHVKKQQASLFYVGNGDYYGIGFTNWFLYNA